jgi:hypothetical protein
MNEVPMTDRELDRDDFKHEVRELLAQLIADTQGAALGGRLPDAAAVADEIAALAERTRFS